LKRVLIAAVALLVLAFASPASALTQDEAQQMAQSVGCQATVRAMNSYEGFNAYYDSVSNAIYLINFSVIPESWQRLIAWHEIGHCLQWKEGRQVKLREAGLYEREWDADRFAIEMLTNEGIDGAELNASIWADIYRQFNYAGDADEAHGTLVGRITRGNLNRKQVILQS